MKTQNKFLMGGLCSLYCFLICSCFFSFAPISVLLTMLWPCVLIAITSTIVYDQAKGKDSPF